MRAKKIYEIVDFRRGKNPKTAMDIGMTPERRLDSLKAELEPFGIKMEWARDHNMGDGFYEINFNDDDTMVGLRGALTSLKLQAGYATDEAAMAEYDSPGGFWLANNHGDHIIDPNDVSHNHKNFIRVLLDLKYKDRERDLDRKVKVLRIQLNRLERAKAFLEDEG